MRFRNNIVLWMIVAFFFGGFVIGMLGSIIKSLMGYGKVILVALAFVSGVFAQETKLFTPAQAVAAAAADLASIRVDRSDVRYFSLYDIPEANRADFIQTFSGHVNGLSRESDIIKPTVVPNTGNSVLRVLMSDYGWDAKVWEKLRDVEPYFHAFIEEVVEEEVNQPYGRFFDNQGNSFTEAGPGRVFRITEHKLEKQTRKIRKFSAQAPWLVSTKEDATRLQFLVSNTASECPIVRADWFLWQTGLQADRVPGYYDFLGVKKLADFHKLVGFNGEFNKETNRREYLEAVAESGIAQQPRRIRRDNTNSVMGLWTTFDNRTAVDQHNPLRVLNGEFKFDASEMFGPLPNNLWAYALFSSAGDRQDSAPDFIGHDSTSRSNDGRIHVGLSCIRCHNPNSGLNSIDAWARNLLQPPLALQSPFPDKIRQLRQQYLRDLNGPIDSDKTTFERALREATGFTPKDYARKYGDLYAGYDLGVDVERAGVDLGVSGEALRKALDRQLIATGSVDTVLSVFLRPKEQQKLVGIRQWQELVSTAHQTLAAYPEKK